jgi:glycosyltransferase involved in cell wall biosynthesis
MMNPTVSVIIPTFNSERCLHRAVDSVLKQTRQDFEVLICDDASNDATAEIAQAYAVADSRLKILAAESNRGAGYARNMGLEAAVGKFIAFLDSDDEWLPQKLELEMAYFQEHSAVSICLSGAHIIKNNGGGYSIYTPVKSWCDKSWEKFVLGKIRFVTPTITFKRDLLQSAGLMAPEMRRTQDIEFLFRLLYYGNLGVIQEPLANIHLVVSAKKAVYRRQLEALKYHERHIVTVKRELGFFAAKWYASRLQRNLVISALREFLWAKAFKHFIYRVRIFPFFHYKEIVQLVKALLISIYESIAGKRIMRCRIK